MNISKKNKIILIIICVSFIVITFLIAFLLRNHNENRYRMAGELNEKKEYSEAAAIYAALGKYKDSEKKKQVSSQNAQKKEIYKKACKLYQNKLFLEALAEFEKVSNFDNSVEMIRKCKYELAVSLYEKGKLDEALKYFLLLDDSNEVKKYIKKIELKKSVITTKKTYLKAVKLYKAKKYKEALELFIELKDYNKKCPEYVKKCRVMIRRCSLDNVLAAGVRNSAAITNTGNILVAGTNDNGQKSTQNFKDIDSIDAYGYFVVGLTKKGKVVFSGKSEDKVDTSDWRNIIDVACGENFIVGLDKNGKVYATGHDTNGQLEVKNWHDVIAVDAGWSFTVALTKKGELYFAGSDNGQKEEYERKKKEWENVINIAASGGGPHDRQRGKGHTVGLCTDGTVVAIGDNSHDQCNVSEWRDIVKIAAGDWYTVGIDKYGKAFITGENFPNSQYIDEKILSKLDNVIDIAAGFGQSLFLKSNGTLVTFGFDDENKLNETKEWRNLKVDN